jgi:hypothetical protein
LSHGPKNVTLSAAISAKPLKRLIKRMSKHLTRQSRN